MSIKEKAYIEKNDIVDRLKELTKLAERGYISFLDETYELDDIKLTFKIKERK